LNTSSPVEGVTLFICGHEVHFAVRLCILCVVHWTSISWSVCQMVEWISEQ